MSLSFLYSITDKGRNYLFKLRDNAPHYSGEQWNKYAPQAAILETLDGSMIKMYSNELGNKTGWHGEQLNKALSELVRYEYIKYEGKITR